MQPIRQRTLPVGPSASSVAPGASAILARATNQDTYGMDVYLRALGTGIDPAGNASHAIMRLLLNGSRFPGFDAMASQIGSITQPQVFDPPIYLGRAVDVQVTGEMDAGAVGNTTMAATFHLLLVKP